MNRAYLSAVIIEIIGISATSIGICYEYASGETIGFIIITAGSVLVAIGSLMYAKVYSKLKKY